ncbi:hypothetical protein HDU81_005324 [Chytriomyces hyalinus]|nr:hypothetical protein HDU81_005324 [Chytriomyces hyalinus]
METKQQLQHASTASESSGSDFDAHEQGAGNGAASRKSAKARARLSRVARNRESQRVHRDRKRQHQAHLEARVAQLTARAAELRLALRNNSNNDPNTQTSNPDFRNLSVVSNKNDSLLSGVRTTDLATRARDESPTTAHQISGGVRTLDTVNLNVSDADSEHLRFWKLKLAALRVENSNLKYIAYSFSQPSTA